MAVSATTFTVNVCVVGVFVPSQGRHGHGVAARDAGGRPEHQDAVLRVGDDAGRGDLDRGEQVAPMPDGRRRESASIAWSTVVALPLTVIAWSTVWKPKSE